MAGAFPVLPRANFAKIREMPTKMPTIFQSNAELLPTFKSNKNKAQLNHHHPGGIVTQVQTDII